MFLYNKIQIIRSILFGILCIKGCNTGNHRALLRLRSQFRHLALKFSVFYSYPRKRSKYPGLLARISLKLKIGAP